MTSAMRLGEVADVVSGVGFPKELQGQSEGEVPVFKVGDISNAVKSGTRYLRTSPNHLSKEAARRLAANLMPAGTTVFAKIGEGLKLNRRAVLAQPSLVDNNVMGLVPKIGVATSAYLYYFMQTVDLGALSQATAVPSVRKSDVVEISIPVPSVHRQSEIVAEIDKQFSRLDEAVANLQRVKANLKNFKTATLSSAVEGRLVITEAEIVRRNGGRIESGDQLLQHILDVRRNAWRSMGKYVGPETTTPAGLPNLPEGWTWAAIGVLGRDPFNTVQTGPFGAQLHNTDFTQTGVPVIAVGNLTGTGFRREGLYFVDAAKAARLSRYDVWAGDLLFARSGATLGKVCVAPPDVADWRMTGHILRARLNTQLINPEVAVYALAALPAVRKQVFGSVRGVTRPGFNTSLLESIFIPVPPFAEQHRIVAEVDRRLSIVREVEAEVDVNLKRAMALRQAVLRAQFGVEKEGTI